MPFADALGPFAARFGVFELIGDTRDGDRLDLHHVLGMEAAAVDHQRNARGLFEEAEFSRGDRRRESQRREFRDVGEGHHRPVRLSPPLGAKDAEGLRGQQPADPFTDVRLRGNGIAGPFEVGSEHGLIGDVHEEVLVTGLVGASARDQGQQLAEVFDQSLLPPRALHRMDARGKLQASCQRGIK